MTKARELDVVIVRITPKTVYYQLAQNRKMEEHWRVPRESDFDLSQLQEGRRYRVLTKTIWSNVFSYKKQQMEWREVYDWVQVQDLSLTAKSTTMTRKQSEQSRAIAERPLAGDGSLFTWGDNKNK